MVVTSANMISSSETEQDIKTALDISESGALMLDAFCKNDSVNYIYKLKSSIYMQKAWWLACLKRTGEMHACVEEAYRMAHLYDTEAVSTDFSSSLKFLNRTEVHVFDSIGADAVSGIDSLLKDLAEETHGKNRESFDEVKKY